MKVDAIKAIKTIAIASLAVAVFLIIACSDSKDSSTGPSGGEDTTYTYIFDDTIQPGDSVHLTAPVFPPFSVQP